MFKCVWDRQSGAACASAAPASPLQQRRACSRSLELIQRMELSAVLEGHQGCVNTVAFDPEGRLLVSGSDDQRILVWDWMAGAQVLSWDSGHHNNVFQARFLPGTNNGVLVSCAADGQVRAADVPQGAGARDVRTRRLAGHDGRAHRLALDPAAPSTCFYSCGEDGNILHFDLRQPPQRVCRRMVACAAPRGGPPNWAELSLNCIDAHPRAPHLVAVGGYDARARVYDVRGSAPASDVALAAANAWGAPPRPGGMQSQAPVLGDTPVALLAPAALRGGQNRSGLAAIGLAQRRQITGIQFARGYAKALQLATTCRW